MPRRFCICTGCSGCGQDSRCGKLFDRELTGKMRCPLCQPVVDRRRNARPNTTARGYGREHQALRAQLLGQFQAGQPCWRCGKPIWTKADAHLGHDDNDRTRYRGLEHVGCNEATASRKADPCSPS